MQAAHFIARRCPVAGAPEESIKVMEQIGMKSASKVWWRSTGLVLAALVFSGCALSPEAKEARFLEAGKKALARNEYSRAIIQFRNAIRIKKRNAETYYQLGLAYLGAGDAGSAFKAFSAATELDPKHKDAQVKYSELLILTKQEERLKNAKQRLGDVLKSTPDDADALNALAIAEWQLGSREDAEQRLDRALMNSPKDLQATVTLAKMKIVKGDLAAAGELVKKIAAQQPPSADAFLAAAQLSAMMQRLPDAEQYFRRALQIDKDNVLALYDLANLLLATGKADQAEPFYSRLSKTSERQYRPLHALFLFNSGKTQQGTSEFEQLVKQDPKDRKARSMLIGAYWRTNRPADAEKVLAQALKDNPKDIDALTQRSAIYISVGRLTEAQADLTRALRLEPQSAEAHYLVSRIHRARGANLTRRQELAEAVRSKPSFLQARIELAQMLVTAGSPKAALDLMTADNVPKAQGRSVPAIVQKNWALLALGNNAELRKSVDQGLAIARVPDLLLQDAILKIQQNPAAARTSIDEAISQNPDDLRVIDLMVMTYRSQKQPAAVLPKLREYGAKYPTSVGIQCALGDWLLALGDVPAAQAAFAKARQLNASFQPAAVGYARAAMAGGKPDEARKALSSVLSSDPRNNVAALLLGNLENLAGNRSRALELYTKLASDDPSNVAALNNAAFLLADHANNPDEALKYAQRAKELSPDNPEIEDTLGWVLYHKGMYDLALRHLEASVAQATTPQRRYHLAMAYFKTGNRKRGQQALQAALQENPNLPEAKVALELQAQAALEPNKQKN